MPIRNAILLIAMIRICSCYYINKVDRAIWLYYLSFEEGGDLDYIA
jgi:hypothetical protein